MSSVSGVRFEGPLTSYAVGFAAELARLGYTPESTVLQLRLVAHLSRWMVFQEILSNVVAAPG